VSHIDTAVKIEDISPVKKKLSFEVPWADVKTELDTAYRKVGKTARIKGFRPGKIPREILEQFYRHEAEDETVTNLVNRYYWEALQEKKILAVTRPEVEQNGIEADKNFTFAATVEVEPVVEPKNYLALELEKGDPAVTEEDIQARLQEIRQMFATMEEVKEGRGVLEGDFVNIDFEGTVDGEALKELKSENYMLEIGSKSFVPGFEDQLIGAMVAETRTVKVRFPDNYHAEKLAGKDVEFNVNVKGLRTKKLPEINEEFVKNFERYDSLEALMADVRKSLEEEKQHKVDADLEMQISDKLLAGNEFDVPESFVERQVYYMVSDTQRRMAARGMDPKKAMDFSLKMKDQFREEAAKIVKTMLLLKGIAEKENLTVDEAKVEERIREIATQKGETVESMKKSLEKDDMLDSIRSEILNRQTYEFLESKASVKTAGTKKKG
jgi:trigger factor